MKFNGFSLLLFFVLFSSLTYGQAPWERVTLSPQENTLNDICKIPGTDKLIPGLNAVYFTDENPGIVFGENGLVLKTTTGGVKGFEETKEKTSNFLFEVYPNPFIDRINISIKAEVQEQIIMSVYDLNGKLVLTKPFDNIKNEQNLNFLDLEYGLYFCNL